MYVKLVKTETQYVLVIGDGQKIYKSFSSNRCIELISVASVLQIHIDNIRDFGVEVQSELNIYIGAA
jgi:hypothetical protein